MMSIWRRNCRRGISTEMLMLMGIAFFVLAVILIALGTKFYGGPSGFINTFKNLIPSFGDVKTPEGVTLIGLNLEDGSLRYYSGTKWEEIETDEKGESVLGDFKFKKADVLAEINTFYRFPRKPPEYLFSVSDWRYWTAYSGGDLNVAVEDKIKNNFQGPGKVILSFTLDNKLRAGVGPYLDNEYFNQVYSDEIKKFIAYRDQILEGGPCEAFVKKFNLGGSPVSYTVKKIDNYLILDLAKPVPEGSEEKYKDGCFGVENYLDNVDRSTWKNNAFVEIDFKKDRNIGKLWWKKDAWYYQSGDTGWSFVPIYHPDTNNRENTKVPEELRATHWNLFYKGLSETIAKKDNGLDKFGAKSIEVFVGKEGAMKKLEIWRSEFGIFDDVGSFKDENSFKRFIYEILNEYNRYLAET